MKKPFSREQALLLQRNGEKRLERGLRRKRRKLSDDTPPPSSHDAYKNWKQVQLPEIFSLSDNYGGVVKEINRLRDSEGKKRYINFDAIRQVDAAAALMLAAELEVGKIRAKAATMKAHDSDWDPTVRELLWQMGFMDLLNVDAEVPQSPSVSERQVFIKFMSGHDMQKEASKRIFDEIQKSLVSEKMLQELQYSMYPGMTETITNTCHHGYPKPADELNRWWTSASVDRKTKKISVVCYDRGKTIPRTIRDTMRYTEAGMQKFFAYFKSSDPDHKIVVDALKYGRSSTRAPNRGRGLPALKRLIDTNRQGTLTIYSREGMARYSVKDGKNGENSYFSRPLPRRMLGTLVEWSIIPRTEA